MPKFLLLLVATISALAACVDDPRPGVVKGHVDIGPIMPVQRIGVKEVVPPEMYRAMKIVLLSADGKKELKRYPLTDQGDFEFKFLPGKYRLTWDGPHARFRKPDPKLLDLQPGKTVKIDFNIDTGIR